MSEILAFLLTFLPFPITDTVDYTRFYCIHGKTGFADCYKTCYNSDDIMVRNTYCAYSGPYDYSCTSCTYTVAVGNWCTSSKSTSCPQ